MEPWEYVNYFLKNEWVSLLLQGKQLWTFDANDKIGSSELELEF